MLKQFFELLDATPDWVIASVLITAMILVLRLRGPAWWRKAKWDYKTRDYVE